jgi:hypothetical protein
MKEIKYHDDCTPHIANLFTDSGHMVPKPERVFTASEVGQIIALAMDAASSVKHPKRTADELSNFEAWRELSERLKGQP